MLINYSCTTSIDNSLFEFTKLPRRSQSSFSVNLPWTACRFVCNVSISLNFPSANIINWLKLEQSKNYRVKIIVRKHPFLLALRRWGRFRRLVSPMIESLRTTQIAFFRLATPSGFLGGGDEVQKVFVQGSVQGKIVWNHLWEHRFSVPDPRVFSPPGDRFSAQTTENRIYNWAALKGAAQ